MSAFRSYCRQYAPLPSYYYYRQAPYEVAARPSQYADRNWYYQPEYYEDRLRYYADRPYDVSRNRYFTDLDFILIHSFWLKNEYFCV